MSMKEGPNPLRPYYIPPSAEPLNLPKQNGSRTSDARRATAPKTSLGSSARDMLSDLDYSDYLNDASPSLMEVLRSLVDQGIWKYTSVLMAQPFDVAKTVLQVQLASAVEERKTGRKQGSVAERGEASQNPYGLESDDSGDDSTSYFTSAAPSSSDRAPRTPRLNRRHFASRSPSPDAPTIPSQGKRTSSSRYISSSHTIALTSNSSLTAVISHLWASEGAWGVWKGSNSTFVHSVLLSSLTTFLRSLICAALALPDPSTPTSAAFIAGMPTPSNLPVGGLDVLSSPSPLTSLLAATLASTFASLLLAPIDIARTRLMLTPSTHPPRSLPSALRALRSWFVPAHLALPTVLHGALPTLVGAATPLVCRARLGVDPVLTPTSYAVATFMSQAGEIALRLPVETVLRRGQISYAREQDRDEGPTPSAKAVAGRAARARQQVQMGSGAGEDFETVVPVGHYRGLLGTMYVVVFEEGERVSKSEKAKEGIARATGKVDGVRPQQGVKRKKGQGVEGLYRGWRVGMWGLLGVWGATMLGGGGKGGEF